jgi:hypothetical protein
MVYRAEHAVWDPDYVLPSEDSNRCSCHRMWHPDVISRRELDVIARGGELFACGLTNRVEASGVNDHSAYRRERKNAENL